MIHFVKVGNVLVQLEQPERYHPMKEAEDDKIGSCKVLTYALAVAIAVITFIFIWCVTK
jgi:hypothetical protein